MDTQKHEELEMDTQKHEELTDEEVSLAEDSIQRSLESNVNLNFVQYFQSTYPHTYDEFLHVRDICRNGGLELHKPINTAASELCLPLVVLRQIFGNKVFIKFISNENMEVFRRNLLRYHKIKYCQCGCTALMMEVEDACRGRVNWGKFTTETALKMCERQSQYLSNNMKCKRKLQTIQFFRDIEASETASRRCVDKTCETPLNLATQPDQSQSPSSPSLLSESQGTADTTDLDENENHIVSDSQAIVD